MYPCMLLATFGNANRNFVPGKRIANGQAGRAAACRSIPRRARIEYLPLENRPAASVCSNLLRGQELRKSPVANLRVGHGG